MGRTSGFWEQDSPFPDGRSFIAAATTQITAGAGVKTRSALGLVGFALAASQTVTFDFDLSSYIFRFGKQDDEQQAFGSATGVGQNSLPVTAGVVPGYGQFATNLQQSGRPPFTIAQNQVVPTSRPKGVNITFIGPFYSVTGAALTSISLGLTKTVFGNTVPPVVTNLLAAGTNGLNTAVNANPYTTGAFIPSPQMLNVSLSQYIAELTLVLPAGCTAFVYGLNIGISYNYN